MAFRLKPLLPRGLYGRAALILIVPIVTIQLVVSIVFIQRHFERVTEQMTAGVVLEMGHILDVLARDGAAPAAAAAAALDIRLLAGATQAADRRGLADFSGRIVVRQLRAGLAGVTGVDLGDGGGVVRLGIAPPLGPLVLEIDRRRVSASNPHQLLVLMVAAGALLTGIAYLFLRNQLRPITRLAAAAEAFGKGQTLSYSPRGALEVRAAGAAFLEMRERIERQIEQRTLLLSGVSHDLRTPLTRLKLGLAMLRDDPEVDALQRDLAEMERMLDGFLAFARGDATEAPQPVDPVALAETVAANARRAGLRVELLPPSLPPGARPVLRRDAVVRALENLLGNAGRFGTRAELSLEADARHIVFAVEDDGPGIPSERRDEALRPFTRLDAARDPNRGGGVGLGLAIAADIARSHGGTLRLADGRRLPGLRAELVLAR
jgi:two-component system osmolarity sensor histidine kinase EnvZ